MTLSARNRPFLSLAARANLGDGIGAQALPRRATPITRDPARARYVVAELGTAALAQGGWRRLRFASAPATLRDD